MCPSPHAEGGTSLPLSLAGFRVQVKKTTKMDKIFNTYAERKGVNSQSLRFFLDGNRIQGTDTPGSLDLQDEDQIDCMLEQQGGSF